MKSTFYPAVILCLFLMFFLPIASPAVASENFATAKTLWSLNPDDLAKMGIEAKKITSVRFSGDGSKLIVLEHGFGGSCTFNVFDTKTGKLFGSHDVPVNLVSAFIPNIDGSKVFYVVDYGYSAQVIDFISGRVRTFYTKEPNKGFRFMLPVSLFPGEDNSVTTGGYFLNDSGMTEGDYLVTFDQVFNEGTTISRSLDIGKLLARAGGKGKVISIRCPENFKEAYYVVADDAESSKLFYASMQDDKPAQLIDAGKGINFIFPDSKYETLFYCILYEDFSPMLVVFDLSLIHI